MTEIDRLLSDGATLDDIKEALLDERELDEELQGNPYINTGENYD